MAKLARPPSAEASRPPHEKPPTPRKKPRRLRRLDRPLGGIGDLKLGFGGIGVGLVLDDEAAVRAGDGVEPEGARPLLFLFAHVSRSPNRNWQARSSLMCGRGAGPSGPGREGRAEAQEAIVRFAFRHGQPVAAKDRARIGRQLARKDRRLGRAVESLAVERLAGERRADNGVERLAAVPHRGLARRPHGGERDDVDFGAGKFRARDGARRSPAAESPPAGRGSCGADGRPWSRRPGSCRSSAGTVAAARWRGRRGRRPAPRSERVLQIAQGGGAGIQRRQGVDQHDLAVEPGEMVAEEGAAPRLLYDS